ncbi:baculoviral IAP repeat-containing protein 1-like [Rhinophrynus dorsalis]
MEDPHTRGEIADNMNITDIDPSELENRLPFLHYDFHNVSVVLNRKFAAIRQQLGNSFNFEMRSEAKRLKSFLSYNKLSSWCPSAMANAGFYFTGVDLSIQCFCCGLILCVTSLRKQPYENHVKHNPACGFIQGRDVGNIPKYEVRVQPSENDQRDVQEYTAEESRLQSFTDWPFYARIQPDKLSIAGFFFTGRRDTVQCFSCKGCLGNWEETDDPWKEHAKWFPECCFLMSRKTPDEIKQYITCYRGFPEFAGKNFTQSFGDRILPTVPGSTNLNIFENEGVRLESFKGWPEDANATPADLAKAGFFYTGISDTVICFCCEIGLHMFEPGDDPYLEHLKHNSTCEFLQTLTDMKQKMIFNEHQIHNEPVQLLLCLLLPCLADLLDLFHALWVPDCDLMPSKKKTVAKKVAVEGTGPLGPFLSRLSLHVPESPGVPKTGLVPASSESHSGGTSERMKSDLRGASFCMMEDIRLMTSDIKMALHEEIVDLRRDFSNWVDLVEEANMEISDQEKTTTTLESGGRRAVQEKTSRPDPTADHLHRVFLAMPVLNFLTILSCRCSLIRDIRSLRQLQHDRSQKSDECWIHEARKLKHQLVDLYNSPSFSKLSPFPNSSHVSIDLKSLFADISVTSKDIRDQPLEQLTLPDILSDLGDITMIEGEAGSGKTALLKKIAILWASGCCTILSRFSLVFYISLSSTDGQQTLTDIICKQLIGPSSYLTEETLVEIMEGLKNQVLFLVDDYGVMDPVPEAIEELFLNNHWNRLSLAVTVRKDRGRKLRQGARTILSIQDFPLYSSISIYRELFSHNILFLEVFVVSLEASKTCQAALKTPLFTFALCIFWIQNANENTASDISVCRAYLMLNLLKHPKETEIAEALVLSCGELALNGLFQSQFDFTDEDLSAACVNSDHVLKFGLMIKFTSQRLQPIYRFFHPSFQEFLAAKRISELLQSVDNVQQKKGFLYLNEINTFLRVVGRFYNFLKYSCIHSPKTTSIIISHLFSLLNNSEAFDCQSDTKLHLQHHPEQAWREEILKASSSSNPDLHLSFVIHMVLNFAIEAAHHGMSMTEYAQIILQFLKGKDIYVDLEFPNKDLFQFFTEYPEGLSLIRSLHLFIRENDTDLNCLQKDEFDSDWDLPEVDQDYSMAFPPVTNTALNEDVNSYYRNNIDLSSFGFNQSHYKVPVLKVEAKCINKSKEKIVQNLMIFFSISDHIELELQKCQGFVECIHPCIEKYKDLFVKFSICNVKLTTEEQELITQMCSLQSLKITDGQAPEYLLTNLDKFKQLKELILSGIWDVFGFLTESLKSLSFLEKLVIKTVTAMSSSFADIISNLTNLTSFHLNCDWCPEFGKLMAAISKNGKIQELNMHGSFIASKDIIYLASALQSLKHLKVLDIGGQQFINIEDAKILAQALPSLVHLEELELPSGSAMKDTATSIIQQFQYLPNLRILIFNKVLNDISLLSLAKQTSTGLLNNIQKLHLAVNHDVTQSGWRDFFQTVHNLPKLNELYITRLYSHMFKMDPLTMIALVQCVSRLHSLNTLSMHGWLLDEKDVDMFESMKKNHPQAKSFLLLWQWTLPFSPL